MNGFFFFLALITALLFCCEYDLKYVENGKEHTFGFVKKVKK